MYYLCFRNYTCYLALVLMLFLIHQNHRHICYVHLCHSVRMDLNEMNRLNVGVHLRMQYSR